MQRFTRLEKWIMLISAAGMLVAGGYLLMPDAKVQRARFVDNGSIGYIKPLGADVRLRGKTDNQWNNIQVDANVFQSDKVFTGRRSSALVVLKSKQQLLVEPNSLVVVSDNNENVFIDLNAGGSFLAELKRGVKFFVKKDGEQIELEGDGGSISFTAPKNAPVKFVVIKGEAKVRMAPEKEPVSVVANTEVTVDHAQVNMRSLSIELQKPASSEMLWGTGSALEFSWKFIGESKGNEIVWVEVAEEPTFERTIARVHADRTSVNFPVSGRGVYFWRVRSTGNDQVVSATSSFSRYPLLSPSIHENATMDVETDWRGQMTRAIVLAWNDPSLSEEYKFQLSDDSNFSNIVYSERTQERQVALLKLKTGTYFWRVVSYHTARTELVSKTGRLQLVSKSADTPVVAPVQETPTVPVTELSPQEPELELVEKSPIAPALEAPIVNEVPMPQTQHFEIAKVEEAVSPVKKEKAKAKKRPPRKIAKTGLIPVEKTPSESSESTALGEPESSAPAPEINRESVQMPVLGDSKKARVLAYLGLGTHYLSLEQSSSDNLEAGKYSEIKGLTSMLGVQINLNETSTLEFQYNSRPGEMQPSSPTTDLRQSDFDWKSYLAEYQYLFKQSDGIQYSLLLGLQVHQLPFLSTAPDGVVDILYNEFLNASVGVKATHLGATGLEYEVIARYQHPLSHKSIDGYDFTAKPVFMFDGSLGVSKRFGERFKAGLYWFGQYQNFQYSFNRDGSPISGEQSFLNSNIQIRFGWEFFGMLSVATLPLIGRQVRRKKCQNGQKKVA